MAPPPLSPLEMNLKPTPSEIELLNPLPQKENLIKPENISISQKNYILEAPHPEPVAIPTKANETPSQRLTKKSEVQFVFKQGVNNIPGPFRNSIFLLEDVVKIQQSKTKQKKSNLNPNAPEFVCSLKRSSPPPPLPLPIQRHNPNIWIEKKLPSKEPIEIPYHLLKPIENKSNSTTSSEPTAKRASIKLNPTKNYVTKTSRFSKRID